MKMTEKEKARAYYRAAREAIDYIWTCADKRIVPLKHDANLMKSRLEQIRVAEVER